MAHPIIFSATMTGLCRLASIYPKNWFSTYPETENIAPGAALLAKMSFFMDPEALSCRFFSGTYHIVPHRLPVETSSNLSVSASNVSHSGLPGDFMLLSPYGGHIEVQRGFHRSFTWI